MHEFRRQACWFGFGFLVVIATSATAQDRYSSDQIAFFEERIRPVLIEHCYECHSAGAKKLKGGLRLDSRIASVRGGDTGPALVPGHADESLLIEAVRYASLEMPPRGKLPDRVIHDLVRWIEMGAPDPRTETRSETEQVFESDGDQHWAFQPVRHFPIPQVEDSRWPATPVDHFILATLERAGLQPAGDADRYTWLRRVSLDLTGLPPTLEEIHGFVNDTSPRADEAVVDRLLASRAFGERWARHWLDLVGYADQIGTSNDVFAEHAWRYRDYVIHALNSDLPFDRFIREQIAGDLLNLRTVDEQAAAIVATGFLVLGDLEIVEADKAKMRVDIVDQQVVKTSKAFLGLTVGCARCHDHKFDPISQRDYYAMAGFFYNTQSVYKTDRGVWSDVMRRELPETPDQALVRAAKAELHAKQLVAWNVEQTSLTKEIAELDAALAATETANKELLTKDRDAKNGRIHDLDQKIVHAEFFAPGVPHTYGVQDLQECHDMQITIRGNPHALGEAVPRGFVKVAARTIDGPTLSSEGSGRLALADWIADTNNPLTARVAVNRIWQKLFGSGLVASVDYFGVRSETPTHPELLDHLAWEFMQSGWSQKDLIRTLVLSRTYRMSSAHAPEAQELDPTNRLLWRMPRRRLDAEAIRDSMLAIGGQLQDSTGGPSLPLEYVENVGNVDPKNVNPPSFSLRRYRPEQAFQRTIYLPIVRSAGQPGPAELRNVFDFPQPAQFIGLRATTAVPTQALFLMNSPDVKQHAQLLAQRLRREVVSDDARLKTLWLLVMNRPPTREETTQAKKFATDDDSWTELCHALLATNEFLMTL